MSVSAHRRVLRIVGTSCLAAALALSTAAAAPGTPAREGDTAAPGEPTPPPPPPSQPDAPPPSQPDAPGPDQPDTAEPGEPGTPTAESPGTPTSEPGTPPGQPDTSTSPPPGTGASEGPSTPASGGPTTTGGDVRNLTQQDELKKDINQQVDALDASEDVKKQIRDGLDKFLALYADTQSGYRRDQLMAGLRGIAAALQMARSPLTAAADRSVYASIAASMANPPLLSTDPKTAEQQRNGFSFLVFVMGNKLSDIRGGKYPAEDQATYLKAMQAIGASWSLMRDPKTLPATWQTYDELTNELGLNLFYADHYPVGSPDRARHLSQAERISNAVLTALAQKPAPGATPDATPGGTTPGGTTPGTAPKNPQDTERVLTILKDAAAALAAVQNPDTPPQEREAAQRALDALDAAPNNPKYLEFLAELKKYDPPATCLKTIESRTAQVGWPEGALWGLSDDTCAGTLITAARDNGSRWNALFVCVRDSAFSTCTASVPDD
ncbi:hypothetical protein OG216_00695 [Streptomycetaceae bacterium NBC_01309]